MTVAISVSAAKMSVLQMRLLDSGVLVASGNAFVAAPGIDINYSTPGAAFGNKVFASVLLSDGVTNADDIVASLGDMVNVAGAPKQVFLGQPEPMVDAYATKKQLFLEMAETPFAEGMTLYAAVVAAVEAAPEEVQIWFQTVDGFERHNPMVVGMLPQLGISDTAADDLFARAALRPR